MYVLELIQVIGQEIIQTYHLELATTGPKSPDKSPERREIETLQKQLRFQKELHALELEKAEKKFTDLLAKFNALSTTPQKTETEDRGPCESCSSSAAEAQQLQKQLRDEVCDH